MNALNFFLYFRLEIGTFLIKKNSPKSVGINWNKIREKKTKQKKIRWRERNCSLAHFFPRCNRILCQCSEISIRWLRPVNRIFYVKQSANILTIFIQSKYTTNDQKKFLSSRLSRNVATNPSKSKYLLKQQIFSHAQRRFFSTSSCPKSFINFCFRPMTQFLKGNCETKTELLW